MTKGESGTTTTNLETDMSKILDERDFAHVGNKTASIRAEDVAASTAFRKMYEQLPNVVSAEDMPWEKSADGLIKHLVHEKMNTREMLDRSEEHTSELQSRGLIS